MLGRGGTAYHLEFTRKEGHRAGRAPRKDNLLVFYLPDEADWHAAVERVTGVGYAPARAFNPYSDRHGVTFEDPGGYVGHAARALGTVAYAGRSTSPSASASSAAR